DGVLAVGAMTLLRSLPAGILAPALSAIADRLPRARVLLAVHVGRASMVAIAAFGAIADVAPAIILAAVAAEGLLVGLHRATTLSLMPALARSPEELVAGNAVMSMGEALGGLAGPVTAGLLLMLAGPGLGLIAASLAHGLAAAAVLSIHVIPLRVIPPASPAGGLRTMLGGVAALRRHPSAGVVIGLFASQTLVRGSLTVLVVVAAVELLGLGQSGVGYLTSSIGGGGIFGAVFAMSLVIGRPLSAPFAVSLALWGLPIAVLGILPYPVLAFVLLAAVGAANAALDVAGFTLLQRSVPNAVRGRVFGALEGIAAIGVAAGAAMAPLLVELFGLRAALIVTGAILPVVTVVTYPLLRSVDAAAVVPHRELALLRRLPMFAPLPLTIIEQLAQSLVPVRYATGERIIEQGEAGDCFYVIAVGAVDIIHGARDMGTLRGGDGFGEIALLSDRPRTATVIAREPMEGFRLPREDFLEAVAGSPHSMSAAQGLVSQRLAELGH
ncbi:MAG: cyclic nucleotide-binding domain-containing protein, partial [Chloroflexi bacterium]|nr:cyclic nucleotide-binding domain-containing protein [Chloroflexota bacterium]